MAKPAHVRLVEAAAFERPVAFRFPFRFGVARVTEAPQAVRHTVGLADPMTAADLAPADRLNDGLPETLEEAIAAYGHRYFKLKIAGDPEADTDRLGRIAAILDRLPDYRVTLEGNEQYPDPGSVAAFLDRRAAAPNLDRLRRAILFLESRWPAPSPSRPRSPGYCKPPGGSDGLD